MRQAPRASIQRTFHAYSPRLAVWPAMQSLTDGTDTTPVAGTRYWSSIQINERMTLTGLSLLLGSVGLVSGDKVIVELHDGAGALIATSALAGTAVGTAATVQKVPFINNITVEGPGQYFIAVQFNTAVPRLRTLAAGTSAEQTVTTGSATGTFGVSIAITPGTTFTAGVGPVAFTY